MSEHVEYRGLSSGTCLCGGKYIIERVIGAGGFGITYYAKHATLQQYYAIKEFFINGFCIRESATKRVFVQGIEEQEYEGYKRKFVEEAQVLADLHHPNIVNVIDIFDENGTSYMVMPFIKGITLQSLVEKKGRLPYDLAVNYMAQVCEAVSYIHGKHILHRDITPDNIIITEGDQIALIDFGSARKFVQDKTQRHTAIVKKGYAPLEQYSSTSRNGTYSDIYSVGAVLYFLLTAQKPMDATIRTMENMPAPRSLNPDIPMEAERAIMKAMSLKPEERQQDAAAFMADLLGGIPVQDRPFKAKTVRKPSLEKGRKKLFMVLGTVSLLIGAGIGTWQVAGRMKAEKELLQKVETDAGKYAWLVQQANRLKETPDSLSRACRYLQEAEQLEKAYEATEYSASFNAGAGNLIETLEKQADSLFMLWRNLAMDSYGNYQDNGAEYEKRFALEYIGKALCLKEDASLTNIKSLLEK